MKCTQCKWHSNKYNINAVPFSGNPSADIVFMGGTYTTAEAFSAQEKGTTHFPNTTGIGFDFDTLLKESGIDRNSVAVMNAHRCYHKGNIEPSFSELDSCFMHSFLELSKIKPKLIVVMGGSALYQACQKTGVTNYFGRLMWSDRVNCKVYVIPHPSQIRSMGDDYDVAFREHLNYWERIPLMLSKDHSEIKLYNYTYIANPQDYMNHVHPILSASKELYFDLETTGLDPFRETITLLILGTDRDHIYVLPERILADIRPLLKDLFDNIPVIGQGYEFDAKFLQAQYELFPQHWGHNTMLAEFLLTGARANRLRLLTGKYDPDAYGYDDAVKEVGGAHRVTDLKTLCQYAANDVGVMFPIREAQQKSLVKLDMEELLYKITIPSSKVLTKMSLRGVRYDIEQLNKTNSKYIRLAKEALDQAMQLPEVITMQEETGDAFNPKSSVQIRTLMIDYYKEKVLKTTKSGNASVTQAEMKIYAAKKKNPNRYAQIMEKYRAYEGIQANFLAGVRDQHLIKEDGGKFGVAHTTYSLHIAATGRPTSSNPNLQNIPKDEDIKAVYVARPGYVFVYADLSQIEVRVAAMLSQDPTLMKACNSKGLDFHSVIASEINGYEYDYFYQKAKIEKDKKFDTLRNNAKTTTFGILYGMSAFGLAYRLGMTVNEAEAFIEHYFEKMPQVRDFMRGIKNHVIEHGWVSTYFGFRRYFTKHTSEDHNTIREAQNHPIQGTAWNLMQLILIELDKQLIGTDSHLIMQTYDSAVIEARIEEVDYVAPMMKDVMINVALPYHPLNTVLVKTEIEIGPNLRDLTKVDVDDFTR